MSERARKAIYGVVPVIVMLLVGLGIITNTEGAAIAGLVVTTITLVIAFYNAITKKAAIARTVLYAFAAAVVTALGTWSIISQSQQELILAAVVGALGVLLGESNTGNIVLIPDSDIPLGERFLDADGDGRPDVL